MGTNCYRNLPALQVSQKDKIKLKMKYFLLISILYLGISKSEAADCPEKSPDSPKIYSLHIKSFIKYRYANTIVTSRVVNPANHSQEIVFYMNLPDTAFITSFVMEINGKEYEAYLKEKEEAKKIYDHAIQTGQTAGHVATSSRDSNNFKISVNVEAMGKVRFTLLYEELLQRVLGMYNHVINLNPGQTVQDLSVEVYITESSEIKKIFVPELKVSNEISTDIKENKDVQIIRPKNETKAIIKYTPTVQDQEKIGGKCFDGQFVVQYDVDRTEKCGEILVDDGYFVHFFAPEGLTPLRKLVVFVLDVSGSMYGRKIVQMKQAMSTILDDLKENDYFSIIDFSYSVKVYNLDTITNSSVLAPDAWYNGRGESVLPTTLNEYHSYPATKNYITSAKDIVSKMHADGGTNIYDALKAGIIVSQKAIQKIKDEHKDSKNSAVEPLIIFLTDGEPTVGLTSLRSIHSMVKELNVPITPVYSLGFGYGADISFLKKLSLANSGFARTIYEASDAALQLKNFYKQISSPLLSNVTFTYLPGQVANKSLTKKHFPLLFHGSELVVAGKLASNNINLQSDVNSISENGTNTCTPLKNQIEEEEDDDDNSFQSILERVLPPSKKNQKKSLGSLERPWAYLTIKQLLDELDSLDDDDTEEGKAKREKLKKDAMELALKYKFVTPLTSLVVVKPNETESLSDLNNDQENGAADRIMGFAMVANSPQLSAIGIRTLSIPKLQFRSSGPHSANFAGSAFGGFAGAPGASGFPGAGSFAGAPGPAASAGFPAALPAYTSVKLMARPLPTYSTTPAMLFERADTEDQEEDVIKSQNFTLSDLEWLDQILQDDNKTVIIPDGNSKRSYTIDINPANATFQECKTNSNISGKCTHLINCILPDFTKSLNNFLEYFCPIPGGYVGVCCPPDNSTDITV